MKLSENSTNSHSSVSYFFVQSMSVKLVNLKDKLSKTFGVSIQIFKSFDLAYEESLKQKKTYLFFELPTSEWIRQFFLELRSKYSLFVSSDQLKLILFCKLDEIGVREGYSEFEFLSILEKNISVFDQIDFLKNSIPELINFKKSNNKKGQGVFLFKGGDSKEVIDLNKKSQNQKISTTEQVNVIENKEKFAFFDQEKAKEKGANFIVPISDNAEREFTIQECFEPDQKHNIFPISLKWKLRLKVLFFDIQSKQFVYSISNKSQFEKISSESKNLRNSFFCSVSLPRARILFLLSLNKIENEKVQFNFNIENINKVQRRKHFRFKVYELKNIFLMQNNMKFKVFDISMGGLSVVVDAENEIFFNNKNSFKNMILDIEGKKINIPNLFMRHQSNMEECHDKRVLGLEIDGLSSEDVYFIQYYIFKNNVDYLKKTQIFD